MVIYHFQLLFNKIALNEAQIEIGAATEESRSYKEMAETAEESISFYIFTFSS